MTNPDSKSRRGHVALPLVVGVAAAIALTAMAGVGAVIGAPGEPRSPATTPAPATTGPAAATDAGPTTLADVAFLTGSWRGEFHGDTIEEHFSGPNAGTLIGMFRWISNGRTSMTEHIVFEERADGVHMLLRHFNEGMTPWAQESEESGGALDFKLATATKAGTAVFEDPQRKFPRRIVYEQSGPGELTARLEGHKENGDERTMELSYRRIVMSATATDTLTEAGKSLGYSGGLTISMPVKDLNKAIEFYENVVGFKTQYRLDDMGWAELTTSVARVNIGLSQVETPKVGEQTPVFGVDDIDRARKVLEDRGAKFDGDTMEIPDMVRLATFFDLDGNPIMLFQSLSDEMP